MNSSLRTKKDVERHVADTLSRLNSENEKNLRGFTFARLFFQVKDYEAARKYLSSFLSVRDNHAPAHRLMAQICEAINNPENALQSYKRSLELDPHQIDIVLKICELYCQLSVDHETARYWADRADQLFPHNEIVFKLRECIVSAEGEPNHQELENLILSELKIQPKNVKLRMKLLRLYLDTERLKKAYEYATLPESKTLFIYNVEWYYLLGDIFEAYQEEFGPNLDSQFYVHYLAALDRLIFLTLAEPHSFTCENGKKQYSVNDAAAVLLIFDQLLKKVNEKDIKETFWIDFIHYMKGQLFFYMTSLLLKRVKMDQGNRKEAFRFSAGLALVCYTYKPLNMFPEMWFMKLEDNQQAFIYFLQQGTLRTSFIGHAIINMCKEDESKWLQKLKIEVCIPQVKERIYNRVFSSVIQKDKLSSSYFISDLTFENCSLEFPSELNLKEYDKKAYQLCADSLHHLIWLEMQCDSVGDSEFNISEVFKGLQYSNKNLSKGSCESLCVLDLEAYLYAAVYQAQCMIDKKKNYLNLKNQDSQLSYPPDIADALCSKHHISWWKSAYGLHNCTIKEKLGDHRRVLQHGLEVIRGVGNHGMEVQLVAHLAQKFANKADLLKKETEHKGKIKLKLDIVKVLQQRAIHYWNIALGMLEKMSDGQTLKVPKEQIFSGLNKTLSKNEMKELQEAGHLYIAVYYMDSDKLDEAAEILSKISNPYGSYYLASILQKMASQEENSNTKAILLNKAKSSLLDTMDRIKDDKSHPLNKEIYIILEDIENEFAAELSVNNSQSGDDLEEADSPDAALSYNSSLYVTPSSHKSVRHSTPRPSSKFFNSKSRIESNNEVSHKHFEPSPERLDAQIRALTLNQDTVSKTLLEQQKALVEQQKTFQKALQRTLTEQQKSFSETNKLTADTLKKHSELLEQLQKSLEELKISVAKSHPKSSARKVAYSKEEEDYADYDPSSLLEFYTEESNEDYRNSGYGYNPSSRMVHEAAGPLNYVMSPAIPPGPPPALNHYNYQYPAHAVLPPAPMAERPPYYHTPGQGLPFSEGQQLPQFHFHVASQVGKPPPPIMSSVASLSQGVPLPPLPPPPVSLHPSQPVIPPPSTSLSMPSPWPKPVGVPHAFQIPLSTPTPITASSNVFSQMIPITVPSSTPATSQSTLKNLLTKTPPAPSQISQIQQSTPTSQVASNFSIFTNISKTPETSIQERSRCDSENAGTSDIDGDLEKEVMGDFKPLIPLPAEIVVETGEENEEVLFEDRAKLYRFVDQEWKERGLGIVKILHHNSSGRVRLLMRREQVLKVCANHYITPDMEILPLKNSDRAWTWVAQDFADEELKPEHFCIRFKTAELAIGFKSAFVKAINISKDYRAKNSSSSNLVKLVVSAIPEPFGAKYLPKAGSWNCPTCYVNNGADKLFCVACESKNPNSQTTISSNLSIASTTLSTTDSVSISKLIQDKPLAFNFGGGFKFDNNEKTTVSTSSNSPKNIFGGFTFSSSPTIRDTKSPEPKDREILVVSTKAKNGPQVTKVNSTSSPFSGFSFAKTPTTSSMAIHLSGDVRTVFATDGKKDVFGNAFSKPFSPVTSSTNIQSTTISSSNNENSLSKMQALVQNLTPAYTFETKEGSKTANPASTESKISTVTNSEVSFDASKLSNDGSPEEFEPTVEFKPVVPLPALVEIKTGEEKEEVLFEERAKLFRYDSTLKEWKERGTGMLKILYLEENQKYRILMRRDQVLKICANHNILPEMKLTPLSKCDKAWVWFAKDYSDGDLAEEQFAAKFKNSDIAQNFFNIFEKCQNSLKSPVSEKLPPSDKCAGNSTAFDQLLKPAVNSWNCSKCQKSNMNESSCIYCKAPKDDSTMVMSTQPESSNQKPLSEIFKPPIGSWECKNCYVRNKASENKCVSCKSLNPYNPKLDQSVKQNIQKSLVTEKKDQTFSDILGLGSWECQSCKIRNSSDKTKCNSCETPKNGSSAPSTKESSSIFGNFQFGSSNTSTSTFQFGNPKPKSEFVFGVRPVTQPTTFTFGQSTISDKENESIGFKPSLPANNIANIFGGITQNTLSEKNNGSNKSSSSIFKNFSSPFTFGSDTSVQKTDSESVGFQFGSPQKYEFSFTGVRPRSPVKTPKSPRSPAAPSDADDDESDFDADNIYFQPAIPLPPKVDVKTGEEDENVLYCNRAKLFRFSSGEWKERGVGDIKILLDNKTRKARFLMRREQVLKVCLNHHLTKDLKFSIRGDKSWTWTATDFSESEPSPELFAIRFKTSELAEEFKKAIDDTLKKLEELQPVSSESVSSEVVSKAASSFSFKVDTPTTSTVTSGFGFGALSSQFGISVKSVFGPSSDFNSENSSKAANFSFTEKSIFGQTFKFGSESSVVPAPESIVVDPDIEVIYEATASKDQIAKAAELKLPKNFYLYDKKPPCAGCIGCREEIPPHKGSSADEPTIPATVEESLELPATSPNTNVPFSTSKFASFSFAELASKASSDSLTKSSPSSKNIFADAGAPVFSNLNTTGEETDEVVQSGDIHFEPVIPLPDLVEVKTGEEDETPIFVHRAKLFRYDSNTKQWKERGVGDIKILSHKEKVRFRIILRRDQVHNVACNHCISEDMSLSPMATSDTALCWNALDFSDSPNGEASQFAVRFKLKETLDNFKQVFNNCKEQLVNQSRNTSENQITDELSSTLKLKEESETSSESTPDVVNYGTESKTEESETDSDSSGEEDVLFEKRASLEIFDEKAAKFMPVGIGKLKIVYDDTVFGYHITMKNDNGETMCDHIIAVQTCLRTEGKRAMWAALDLNVEPVVRKQFCVTFSSYEALKEFSLCFEEGKEIAIKSEIVEKTD